MYDLEDRPYEMHLPEQISLSTGEIRDFFRGIKTASTAGESGLSPLHVQQLVLAVE